MLERGYGESGKCCHVDIRRQLRSVKSHSTAFSRILFCCGGETICIHGTSIKLASCPGNLLCLTHSSPKTLLHVGDWISIGPDKPEWHIGPKNGPLHCIHLFFLFNLIGKRVDMLMLQTKDVKRRTNLRHFSEVGWRTDPLVGISLEVWGPFWRGPQQREYVHYGVTAPSSFFITKNVDSCVYFFLSFFQKGVDATELTVLYIFYNALWLLKIKMCDKQGFYVFD